MVSKIIFVALLASLVIMILKDEKLKQNLEGEKQAITSLKKDFWDVARMEHNIEIMRFPDGKHYAIVNIHHAMKSPLLREEEKIQQKGDEYFLVYHKNDKLPKVEVSSIANGARMLVFPIPDERKDDLSFEVKKTFKINDESGAKAFISEDLFYSTRIDEYAIKFDSDNKRIYMGKKIADQLGYVEDDKGRLIKKD